MVIEVTSEAIAGLSMTLGIIVKYGKPNRLKEKK